jgi:hypothetical protein
LGLPASGANTDWVVNITVTGFSANGAVKVVGRGRGNPNTSTINFSVGHVPSVANGAIVKGGGGGWDEDIWVTALGSPTHVIIDVIGYIPTS